MKIKHDIYYYLPGKKRAIGFSTKSTSDLIGLLSEIFYSIEDVQKAILYDTKAKEILQVYIDKGYGADEASKYFTYNPLTYSINWIEKPYAILDSNMPAGMKAKEILKFEQDFKGKRIWKFLIDVNEYGVTK